MLQGNQTNGLMYSHAPHFTGKLETRHEKGHDYNCRSGYKAEACWEDIPIIDKLNLADPAPWWAGGGGEDQVAVIADVFIP